MQIDHNNNIYISIGSEIRVISLRRLSKQKDFIIDIIKMQKIFGRENGVDKVDKSF
jgi:ribosomal protein S17